MPEAAAPLETTQGAPAPADTPAAPSSGPPADASGSNDGTEGSTPSDTGGEGDKGAEDKPRDERGRFKNGTQKRIDELTRTAREREREAAYWKEIATKGQQQADGTAPKADRPKPTPDQFPSFDQYTEALVEWKAEQKVAEVLSRRDAEQAKHAEERAKEARVQTFAERAQLVQAEIPDYVEVIERADVRVPDHVAGLIVESELGPQIAYHLAKHPEQAERIASLPPMQAARELGRIEAQLAKPAAAEAPPARTVTKAPPPMSPVRGTGAPVVKPPEQMTDAEWAAQRLKRTR